MSNSTIPKSHQAAVQREKGQPLLVETRTTPSPASHEILIRVQSIALNPVDNAQLDFGFQMANYPGVVGSDVGGVVVQSGSSVSAFKIGDRITAFAPAFDMQGKADYGAFQQYVLVPETYAAKIPTWMSFNEAAILPMAVQTSMAGWYSIGLSKGPTNAAEQKQGMLVWGGSSSIGTAAIQSAKLLGFTVYATASPKHHTYVRSLGAASVFDYKDKNVVTEITQAVKGDRVILNMAYDAVGALPQILEILKQTKANGTTAKVASAIPLNNEEPETEGVEVKFVLAPSDEKERTDWSRQLFNKWLQEKLESKEYVPSPNIEVFEGGLQGLNAGLDKLKQGMSGTKLVLEVSHN